MKKRLVKCPICQQKGKIVFLGEITDDGFVIERYKNQFVINGKNINKRSRGVTKIIADQFIVECGECKSPIFFRKKRICISSANIIIRNSILTKNYGTNRTI